MSIELSPNESKSVALVNNIEIKKISQLFERILDKLPLSDAQSVFSFEEKQKLLAAFQLKSAAELAQILSVSVSVWRQTAFLMLKPTVVSEEMLSLGFSDQVASLAASLWDRVGPDVLNRLKNFGAGRTQLTDVKWSLNVDVASANRARINQPQGCVELGLQKGGQTHHLPLEMNHTQMYEFYNQLELIQGQLDKLVSK